MVERFFGPVDCGSSAAGTEEEWRDDGQRVSKEGRRRAGYGEEYKIWNSRDVDGTVPADYQRVISRGEEIVGMSLGGMLEAFERRLVRAAKRL